jgi:hypothetical protein
MITDAMTSALQGMQQNTDAMNRHAQQIARWGTGGGDPAAQQIDLHREMVGVLQARRGFEANIPVIRATDEMLGSLIDVFA